MKKAKWMKPMLKSEIKHLAETSGNGKPSMRQLQLNLEGQSKTGVHCFECRSIAHKLNLKFSNMES